MTLWQKLPIAITATDPLRSTDSDKADVRICRYPSMAAHLS